MFTRSEIVTEYNYSVRITMVLLEGNSLNYLTGKVTPCKMWTNLSSLCKLSTQLCKTGKHEHHTMCKLTERNEMQWIEREWEERRKDNERIRGTKTEDGDLGYT